MSQLYYDLLGVTKNSSLLEIKDAYERLSKEYEPSDHQFEPEYVKRYKEVQEAFDWLKNNHVWTINVDEQEPEAEPPQEPEKGDRLINLRYVLLAALLISSVICYLFVSPYFGSGSSRNVVVSNNKYSGVKQPKMNEDYRSKIYTALKGELGDSFNKSFEEFSTLLDTDETYINKVYTALKGEFGDRFTKSEEDFYSLVKEGEQLSEEMMETGQASYSSDGKSFVPPTDGIAITDANGNPIKLSVDRFATLVKTKHPAYSDYDNQVLVDKILDKYPVYRKMIKFPQDVDPFTEFGGHEIYDDSEIPSINEIILKKAKPGEIDRGSPNTIVKLSHGKNPYGYCYTSSTSCSSNCSEIEVRANSSVGTIAIIKQDGELVSCAYIDKGRSFTFKLPSGTYEPFFYSGKGWSNKKYMKTTTQCGRLYGGFTSSVSVGKDTPQTLKNQILSYDLNTQFDGNFKTKSSDVSEAF